MPQGCYGRRDQSITEELMGSKGVIETLITAKATYNTGLGRVDIYMNSQLIC
jgi:hypothetical protein